MQVILIYEETGEIVPGPNGTIIRNDKDVLRAGMDFITNSDKDVDILKLIPYELVKYEMK